MAYQDKAFCASKVKTHTCGRELTEEDQKKAIERKEYITMGKFCEDDSAYQAGYKKGVEDTKVEYEDIIYNLRNQ